MKIIEIEQNIKILKILFLIYCHYLEIIQKTRKKFQYRILHLIIELIENNNNKIIDNKYENLNINNAQNNEFVNNNINKINTIEKDNINIINENNQTINENKINVIEKDNIYNNEFVNNSINITNDKDDVINTNENNSKNVSVDGISTKKRKKK